MRMWEQVYTVPKVIQPEPVTTGACHNQSLSQLEHAADVTLYVCMFTYSMDLAQNLTNIVASALIVTGTVFNWRFRLFLGQCANGKL